MSPKYEVGQWVAVCDLGPGEIVVIPKTQVTQVQPWPAGTIVTFIGGEEGRLPTALIDYTVSDYDPQWYFEEASLRPIDPDKEYADEVEDELCTPQS